MSDQADVNAASSTADVNTDSSTGTDVNADSSSQTQSQYVPYDRFQEVIQQKNELEDKVGTLEEQFETFKTQQTAPPATQTKTEIPDAYDDPAGYAEYVKNQTISEIENKQSAAANLKKEVGERLNVQYKTLKDKHGEIDEDAIGEFAMKHNIRNALNEFDIINAHALMSQIGDTQKTAKKDQRTGLIPDSTSTTTTAKGMDMSQAQLNNTSLDNLTELLAAGHPNSTN